MPICEHLPVNAEILELTFCSCARDDVVRAGSSFFIFWLQLYLKTNDVDCLHDQFYVLLID